MNNRGLESRRNSALLASTVVIALSVASSPAIFAEDPASIPRPSEIVILGFTTDGNPIYVPVPGSNPSPGLQPGLPIPDDRPSYTYSLPDGTTINVPAGQDENGNYVAVPPPPGATLVGPNPNSPIDIAIINENRPFYTYVFSDGTTMDVPAGRDANGNYVAVPPPIGATLVGPSTSSQAPPPLRVNADGSRIEADGSYTPPPLFNPDGTVYGGAPVLRIPGSTTAAPFGFKQDGTPVPPPLFNPDGTPFVLGVSQIPVPKPIIGAPFGYDSLGTPVPAPLWNPDGTPYVHGISELPDVPANLRKPIALTDPIAREIVNQEFAVAEMCIIYANLITKITDEHIQMLAKEKIIDVIEAYQGMWQNRSLATFSMFNRMMQNMCHIREDNVHSGNVDCYRIMNIVKDVLHKRFKFKDEHFIYYMRPD
jgi:hypothetical protein